MKAHIVVGMNFGDEGKGTVTNWLCQDSKKPIVIRYSGGHQAGHTIETRDGVRHVFQSFGAGSLSGVPSFWSKYCVMNPIGLVREMKDLEKINIVPILYIDPMCSVTTIYDILYNQAMEQSRDHYANALSMFSRHGSVGVGVGATYERQETPNKLYFRDLAYPSVVELKLTAIAEYYAHKINNENQYAQEYYYKNDFQKAVENFINAIDIINRSTKNIQCLSDFTIFRSFSTLIFEGSQGILLDQDHGFFPHVTRCSVTSKNAIQMLKDNNVYIHADDVSLHYVTRSYMTRHGVGPFPTEGIIEHLIDVADKTNFHNPWQQSFRKGCLDIELMNYALCSDFNYSIGFQNRNLYITCMDHLKNPERFRVKRKDGIVDITLGELALGIGMITSAIYCSSNPFSEFDKIQDKMNVCEYYV